MDENQKYSLNMQWMRTDGKAKCCKCEKEFNSQEMYMGYENYYCRKHEPAHVKLGRKVFGGLEIIPIIDIQQLNHILSFEYDTDRKEIQVFTLDPHTLLPINKYLVNELGRCQV